MALDSEKENQIFLKLQELSLQIGRLISDFESEKEVRRRLTIDHEKRLRDLELWKSELHGRIVVTVAIATLVWGAIIALILKVIK